MNLLWWKSKPFRLGYLILIIGSVLFLPWWFALLLTLGGILWFPRFYELVLAGLLFDLWYGGPGSEALFKTPVALGIIIVVYLAIGLKSYVTIFR